MEDFGQCGRRGKLGMPSFYLPVQNKSGDNLYNAVEIPAEIINLSIGRTEDMACSGSGTVVDFLND